MAKNLSSIPRTHKVGETGTLGSHPALYLCTKALSHIINKMSFNNNGAKKSKNPEGALPRDHSQCVEGSRSSWDPTTFPGSHSKRRNHLGNVLAPPPNLHFLFVRQRQATGPRFSRKGCAAA